MQSRTEPGAGEISEHVSVRLAHNGMEDGSSSASTASLPLLYMDSHTPPVVSAITPSFGPVHEPTRVTLVGWGLAPTRHLLKCRFGRAPFTGGGWRGNQTVECVAPPASYQLALQAQGESSGGEAAALLAGLDARRGAGTVPARVSIAGGLNASNATWSYASNGFVYYTYAPHRLPPYWPLMRHPCSC